MVQSARLITAEPEITEPVRLCTKSGLLRRRSVGWSRCPLHTCNLRGQWPRKKRWNYWAINNDRYLFSATVANLDYLGIAFVYFLDFGTRRLIEKTFTTPLAVGCRLSDEPSGDATCAHKTLFVSFLDRGEAGTRISVAAPRFGGLPLAADLQVTPAPGQESLNVVIPWSRRRFQFTSKQNALPVSGSVRIGGEEYAFEAGDSFACLDFGRGIWPFSSFWNWGAASGRQNGRVLGLNLGGSWTDGTGMTENGVCIDGRLTKIGEELKFGYSRRDLMRAWTVRTRGSDAVDLRFEPFFERVARTNLFLLKSEVHQLFGHYSGSVLSEDGETVKIEGLLGWVEQHQARW